MAVGSCLRASNLLHLLPGLPTDSVKLENEATSQQPAFPIAATDFLFFVPAWHSLSPQPIWLKGYPAVYSLLWDCSKTGETLPISTPLCLPQETEFYLSITFGEEKGILVFASLIS